MNRETVSTVYKFAIIALGLGSLVYAVLTIPGNVFGWELLLFVSVAFVATPLMSIKLPRTNSALSFSDATIFLSFIIFGGHATILVASLQTLANCVYLKRNGMHFRPWMIAYNTSTSAFSILLTFWGWLFLLAAFNLDYKSTETGTLIAVFGILAMLRFLFMSVLHSPASPNIATKSLWRIWKEEFFSISIGSIAGAGFAFIVYKLINHANFLTTAIALMLLGLAYVNYRRVVSEIKESIDQAKKAEREKAEIAKLKAEEAEAHSLELEKLLKKEEEISADLRRSKDELEYSAYHDALTDLPNRAYLMERLKFLIELGTEMTGGYYIVFLDLSRFKNINDSLGHSVGDQILKIVALRLRRLLRDEDSITRLGGDEFAIILTSLSSMEKAQKVADKIYESITKPFMIQKNKIFSDLHIGIAPLDYEHVKPEDVIRDADIAMQYAKDNNTGIALFDKNIRSTHLERIRLESDLRRAIERKELSMHYQPIISLEDGNIVGFEALLRWNHTELGLISPAQFIPISEETGSIIPITNWILKQTCTQISRWNKSMTGGDGKLYVSVNISGRHLGDDALVRDVKKALLISGLEANLLKLEITESTAMDDPEKTIQILKNLNSMGVQISIDDFGTGYSSLSYLHRLPFDTLKIDRSFVVSAADGDSEDAGILETIVALTKNLNKKVVAEGIETEEQLSLLRNLNCEFGQGYLFCRPLPKEKAAELIIDAKPWLEFGESMNPGSGSIQVDENLRAF